MALFEIIQGSTLFVMIITFIVLTGVLFTEIFKRKNRKEIFYLIIVLYGIVVRIIIDTYWDFAGYKHLILGKEGLFLDFVLFMGIIVVFYKLWGKIDKKLILLIIFSALILIFSSFSLLALTPLIGIIPSKFSLFLLGSTMGFLQAVLVMVISISSYFLVIKFLVDNSEGRK